MNLRLAKYGLIAVLIVVFAFWFRGCFKDKQLPQSFVAPLREETLSQIALSGRHIAVRTHKETKVTYVADGADVMAEIKKDGTIDLNVKKAGFLFRPALGVMVGERLRGTIAAQVGYYNRFEIYGGAAYPHLVGYGAAGYRLDQIKYLQNTSVYVGYTTRNEVVYGLLLRF